MSSSPLDISPVIPVVVFDEPDAAPDLARALVDGGIKIIELTLRTPRALEVISRIAAEVPEILVGAGTVLSAGQARSAAEAGAGFLVSPGATPQLLAGMAATGLPALPGCATVSEVLAARQQGFTELKFFPAEAAGGTQFLTSIAGPVADVRFCPTGGIKLANAAAYLALPNVASVGGTWLTPAPLLGAHDWDKIRDLAATAATLGCPQP